MTSEETLFGELLQSLGEDERQLLGAQPSGAGYYDYSNERYPDAWARFDARFGRLRQESVDTYARLKDAFAAWLRQQTEAWGEFKRLSQELADLGEYRLPEPRPDATMEDAFLRDALARPDEELPLLAFADWLADHGDARAAKVRLVARRRIVAAQMAPEWAEHLDVARRLGSKPPNFLPPRRFSDGSQLVMQRRFYEAQRLNHEYAGTHHVLLGMLHTEGSPTPAALTQLNVTLAAARLATVQLTPPGPDMVISGNMPQTRRGRAAITFAVLEAIAFNDNPLTPDHVLLGLCRAGPCAATGVLRLLGLTPAVVCERVLVHLGREPLRWLQERPEVW